MKKTKSPFQRQTTVLLHIDYLDRKQNWTGEKFLDIKEMLET